MVDNGITRLLRKELVPSRHSTIEIEDNDGPFQSMCVHFHTYHSDVELHVPDVTITDLDAQESELEGKGYLEITLTCQLICNLKGFVPAEPQAGRPRVFNSYHPLQLSNLLAGDQWIREVRCRRSRADSRQTNRCRVCPG